MPCLVSPEPFLSIWALARITIPGMQNPHCKPPLAANASANTLRSPSGTPSSVMISLPSIFSSDCWHDTTALPSINTVQHPHCPDGEQPSLGDVTSSSSRNAASRCGWGRRTTTGCPFNVNEAVTAEFSDAEGASSKVLTVDSLSKLASECTLCPPANRNGRDVLRASGTRRGWSPCAGSPCVGAIPLLDGLGDPEPGEQCDLDHLQPEHRCVPFGEAGVDRFAEQFVPADHHE